MKNTEHFVHIPGNFLMIEKVNEIFTKENNCILFRTEDFKNNANEIPMESLRQNLPESYSLSSGKYTKTQLKTFLFLPLLPQKCLASQIEKLKSKVIL